MPTGSQKFKIHKKGDVTYIRFHHNGKNYDVTEAEAKNILAGTAILLVLLFFISLISND